jgi:NAD(P)H-flavin reductase
MALVRKYNAELSDIQNPFEGIYVLSFTSTEKKFKYLPGQFLHIALDEYDPSRQWPESRCFSMQTNQNDDVLKITYSVKGKFTSRMEQELSIGNQYWLKMPYGDLLQRNHSKKDCVFIAGGTGVTPFLSLFTAPEFSDYENPVLYLGVRSQDFHIYKGELETAEAKNSTFRPSVLNQEKDGMLNIEIIFKEHGNGSIYFISGPPAMIQSFKKYLIENGVSPESVYTDDWE